ncbi:hypothetical protein TTHERM_000146187 (macronuclear) [Tetrahymena thermophila SB210]|uniref:Uncharacterized protein n=1 Tax=Tetrahymena thermophila (strain SB210) TaxID=312017 RepID=W7XFP7_TETTS|nr:hypothetical protein TTHERM_000146187 [Tetrahymena thermophila SB210]EWS75678.1 hypothetical protein TTHERM_000146187 [Tetrahymena thermophila SB210]|eukprot:XP_012651824.1 hypothetical protein TTHERM_000146187 [Tetrahymena thermophila SB210]
MSSKNCISKIKPLGQVTFQTRLPSNVYNSIVEVNKQTYLYSSSIANKQLESRYSEVIVQRIYKLLKEYMWNSAFYILQPKVEPALMQNKAAFVKIDQSLFQEIFRFKFSAIILLPYTQIV